MREEDLSGALENVLEGLFDGVTRERAQAFAAVEQSPAVQEAMNAALAGRLQEFYFTLTYPLDQAVDGLLEKAFPKNAKAQFLVKESRFVERHFRAVIEKFEGSACCADKSRFLTGAMFRHLVHGTPIVVDHTQQYTFHLPERVLNTHESIVAFFSAVYSLFYGRPERFLEEWKALDQAFASAAPSTPAE